MCLKILECKKGRQEILCVPHFHLLVHNVSPESFPDLHTRPWARKVPFWYTRPTYREQDRRYCESNIGLNKLWGRARGGSFFPSTNSHPHGGLGARLPIFVPFLRGKRVHKPRMEEIERAGTAISFKIQSLLRASEVACFLTAEVASEPVSESLTDFSRERAPLGAHTTLIHELYNR